jgi:hypothetical protein
MIRLRLYRWLKPERIVASGADAAAKAWGRPPAARIAFNEQDECWYVYQRRWRWSR